MSRLTPRRNRGWMIAAATTVLVGVQAIASIPGDAHLRFDKVVDGKHKHGAYTFGLYHTSYNNPTFGVINLRDVQVWFDQSFPGAPSGKKKQAVIRGAEVWNARMLNMRFSIHTDEEVTVGTWDGYCATDANGDGNYDVEMRNGSPMSTVHWGDTDGYLGVNKTCLHSFDNGVTHRPWSFSQIYEATERWYSGAGRNVPGGRYDLQSVATHEFGHSTGWGPHYDKGFPAIVGEPELPGGERCDQDDQERWTMCASGVPGSSEERTLEKHDKHTFGAYAAG